VLGPCTGQIELSADGKPIDRSDRISATGNVTDAATLVRFRWLTFVDAFHGAPAIARWLADRHACRDFRYDISSAGDYFPEGAAAAEDD
jgi:hypothetical protein